MWHEPYDLPKSWTLVAMDLFSPCLNLCIFCYILIQPKSTNLGIELVSHGCDGSLVVGFMVICWWHVELGSHAPKSLNTLVLQHSKVVQFNLQGRGFVVFVHLTSSRTIIFCNSKLPCEFIIPSYAFIFSYEPLVFL